MSIAATYLAPHSFERPSRNGPMLGESTGEFASLVAEATPKTESYLPTEVTGTPPVITNTEIKPDPGFTEIVDVPPALSPTDQTSANTGTSAGSAGDTSEDTNQPPVVVTNIGGQTNPKEQTAISSVKDAGGETNQLPVSPAGETNGLTKPPLLETNKLSQNGNGETNALPLMANLNVRRPIDSSSALSSTLRTLLELQETEKN